MKKVLDFLSIENLLFLSILLIPLNMTLSGIILVFLLFKTLRINTQKLIPPFLKKLLLLFITYSLLQGIFIINIFNHYAGIIGHYITYILYFSIINKIINDDTKLENLLKITCFSGVILAITGLIIYCLPINDYQFLHYSSFGGGYLIDIGANNYHDKASGISMNPNILGIYLVLTMILSLSRLKGINVLEISQIIIQSITLFLTRSRGAIFSFFLGLPFLIKTLKFKIVYFLPFLLILIDQTLMDRLYNTFNLSHRENTTRLFVWNKSLEIIKDYPMGIGILNFEDMYRKYNYENFIHIPHAHNWYLQTVLESGLIGAIIFFLFFFSIVILFFKNLKKEDYYLPIALSVFSVFNLTDYVLTDTRIVFILTIIVFTGFYKIQKNNYEL